MAKEKSQSERFAERISDQSGIVVRDREGNIIVDGGKPINTNGETPKENTNVEGTD